jgi:hypothetical protein
MFGKRNGSKETEEYYSDIFEEIDYNADISKKLKMANTTPFKEEAKRKTLNKDIFSTNRDRNKMKRLSELEQNNLYAVLGVEENADFETIKRNYRNLCKINHPDKGGDTEAFQRIQNAYRILSNSFFRKLYDENSIRAFSLIEYLSTQENEIDYSELAKYGFDDINLLIQIEDN